MLARIQVPSQARRGEVMTIRISIQHAMETGYRLDDFGRAYPKNVIHTLSCHYWGKEVFRAEMGSGIAANPYFEFYVLADQSGELRFEWQDDSGVGGAERATVQVVT
jgi:sulfur-oxidizing protein SoxZ